MSERLSVPVPPPLVYVLGLFPGLVLHRKWPLILGLGERPELCALLGSVLLGLGAVVIVWAVWSFSAAGTPLYPERSEAKLVTRGPYRFSRNPIYLGFTLLYLGVAVYRDALWPVLFLPVVLWLLQLSVIRHEERQLEEVLGEEYRAYRDRVRRWL